jgi:hypothetical protein
MYLKYKSEYYAEVNEREVGSAWLYKSPSSEEMGQSRNPSALIQHRFMSLYLFPYLQSPKYTYEVIYFLLCYPTWELDKVRFLCRNETVPRSNTITGNTKLRFTDNTISIKLDIFRSIKTSSREHRPVYAFKMIYTVVYCLWKKLWWGWAIKAHEGRGF